MKQRVRYNNRLPKHVSALLERITQPATRKRGFAEHRLLADWVKIIGPELATHAIPQKIVHNQQSGGCLHIIVEPAWAMEVHYMEPLILERIATFFGYRSITRLTLHQGPLPATNILPVQMDIPPPLPDSPLFATHEDGPLKEALQRLGAQVKKQRDA